MRLSGIPFNLDATLCCGQVFRWEKRGNWWYGVVNDRVVKVRQQSHELEFSGVEEPLIRHYFGLNDDLPRIREAVVRDDYVASAFKESWGLRIIRQPPWECLVSFICATYKSVAGISRMLRALALRFGERLQLDGGAFYGFPSAERLAKVPLSELQSCGLGYRAKYVSETARRVSAGYDFDELQLLPYEAAREKLRSLAGVGLKVADCVLLFGLGRLEAFPVDVWVKRVLIERYGEWLGADVVEKLRGKGGVSDAEYKQLNGFGRDYFGVYAGYAQEYLYHYARWMSNRKVEKP